MTVPQRAAFDLRVSTPRQAEHDVSIPLRADEAQTPAPTEFASRTDPQAGEVNMHRDVAPIGYFHSR